MTTDLMDMMNRSGRGIAEAERFVWMVGSQPSDALNALVSDRLSKGSPAG